MMHYLELYGYGGGRRATLDTHRQVHLASGGIHLLPNLKIFLCRRVDVFAYICIRIPIYIYICIYTYRCHFNFFIKEAHSPVFHGDTSATRFAVTKTQPLLQSLNCPSLQVPAG